MAQSKSRRQPNWIAVAQQNPGNFNELQVYGKVDQRTWDFQMEGSDITRTRELSLPAAKQFVCTGREWQHVRFVFFCHPWGHFRFCEALQGDESSVFAHIDTSSKKCSHSAMWAIISSQDSKTRKKEYCVKEYRLLRPQNIPTTLHY